jgi:hydrogenase maturation protein HypF
MCPECRREYEDPLNRRFHAQPTACPLCGPHLELWDTAGNILNTRQEAMEIGAEILKSGKILALKGLGGFQLLVNAFNEQAVEILRRRKRRARKPLALMIKNIECLYRHCHPNNEEESLLLSPASPIVLVNKNISDSSIASNIAPGSANLGVMLPYTPLHHILTRDLDFPIVCTSGNISDEPIVIDEYEALNRLQGIADFYLVHNRPVARPVDDSVVRIIAGKPLVIRSARGYAPLEVDIDSGGGNIAGAAAGILPRSGHI